MNQKPEKEPNTESLVEGLTGSIERFTFRNQENGFAVIRFQPEDGSGPIQILGPLAQLVEGQQVTISGRRSIHSRYGPQITVAKAEAQLPGSIEGIQAYLASSLVKGIGPATAKRLTDAFGDETLQVIEDHPERLERIKGLGQKRIEELSIAIRAQKDVQKVMVFLRTHGLGPGLATRIVKRFGSGASALIQANPYRLADEVIGIGFKTADRLAGSLGIEPEAPERLEAGTLHVLGLANRDGHCFLPQPELEQKASELLDCEPEAIATALPALIDAGRIVQQRPPGPAVLVESEPMSIYPSALHLAEWGTAKRIGALLDAHSPALALDPERALAWFRSRSGMDLPQGQERAILSALKQPVTVITGGPGVGKTTIIRALAEILTAKGLTLRLAAPTGRAAKRLEESCNRGASTIHRLLEFQPGIGTFGRNDKEPLVGDMLVVDEASMLDIQLAYNLLRAIPNGMKLVLVGDIDQLPAVGPGNVLADLIASGRTAVVKLTEIFRQHGASRIISAAREILDGKVPQSGEEGSDFFFVEAESSSHTRELLRKLVTQRIPKAFGLDPMRDIQVLCPMYRGEAGADAINRELQDHLNPGDQTLERFGKRFRAGDKVMQTKNDYETEVFNGDTGRIERIDETNAYLRVDFGDRLVDYAFSDLDQIVPAYAITVHRSQGSEYPAVVLPMTTEHYMMLRRNLLYTAVTRGKRLVIIVGSKKALGMAVRNHKESDRYSGLCERLREQMR